MKTFERVQFVTIIAALFIIAMFYMNRPTYSIDEVYKHITELDQKIDSTKTFLNSVQAGRKIGITNKSGNIAVTFATPFESEPSVVLQGRHGLIYSIEMTSTSGFIAAVWGIEGAAIAHLPVTFDWIAKEIYTKKL
jgi:hypothetical protein